MEYNLRTEPDIDNENTASQVLQREHEFTKRQWEAGETSIKRFGSAEIWLQRVAMVSHFQQPDWVEEREYQRKAVTSWFQNKGQGIFQMATGTGKTVTALVAASKLAERSETGLALVIAVPYQHLVDQWAEDAEDFGADPILAYQSRKQWQEPLERHLVEFNTGARDAVVVITTHDTFAMEPFQKIIKRLNGSNSMLIADEVHHMGAPHRQESLPQSIQLRLGLSATPERWYDEEGTSALLEYFDDIVFEFDLKSAIDIGALCEYYYIPHIIELTPDETEEYLALSKAIGRLAGNISGELSDADLQDHSSLKQVLFKRARLIGTAENKLPRLESILCREGSIKHTLVYCGDGSVDSSVSGETKRHVDATVQMLRNELDLDTHRFTARESQSKRQQLLDEFENELLQVLVAIRCLDEGVDVPATKTAYMLASSSNPRQFVQRRGRILRPHEQKEYAVIHDFITVPRLDNSPGYLENSEFNAERNLIQKELKRVSMFADAARNHPDAPIDGIPTDSTSLHEVKRKYNLLQM